MPHERVSPHGTQRRPAPPAGTTATLYLDIGLLVIILLLIPVMSYLSGQDSRDGIECHEFQQRRSRGA